MTDFQNEETDFFDDDEIIPHLRWAVISIVVPAAINTPDKSRILKLRWAGPDRNEAEEKAKKFMETDRISVPIMVVDFGKWIGFNDSDEYAERLVSDSDEINRMLEAHAKQTEKAKQYEKERVINAKKNATRYQKQLEKKRLEEEEMIKNKSKNLNTGEILARDVVTESIKNARNAKKNTADLSTKINNNVIKIDQQNSTLQKIDEEYQKTLKQLEEIKKANI